MSAHDFQGVPQELQMYDQWVVWKFETRKDDPKPTKVPYAPTLNEPARASSTKEETWGSFAEARTVYLRSNLYDGIGFVFTEHDPFCGIDLDGVYDFHKEEYTDPLAEDTVIQMNSYTELSPSGTGVHIFVKAKLPPGGNRKGFFEIYDRDRYFTVTGRSLTDQTTVNEKQRQLDTLHKGLFPPQPKREPVPPTEISMEDQAILDKLQGAKSAAKFNALYNGDASAYRHDESRAELALVAMIAFYTQDPDQIDRIFRGSGLVRKKWDERRRDSTYGRNTILKAIDNLNETYTPRGGEKMPRDNRVLETTKVGQNGHESVPRVPLRTGAEGESETAHSENGSSSATVSGASPKYIKRQASATPFPVDAMPKSTRALIRESSVALKAPVDLIAIPMLAVISAAIGNTRKVQMKPRFQQPAGLFLCVVAPPGGNKSPSADVAMRVVDKLQNTYDAEYQKAMRSYEEELREHDAEKARKRAEKETPPAPPTEPRLKEMVVNDTTMEGLAGVLVTNPRGVLNHQDEMSGWVKAMDQYKSGGKGNERSHWLKFYDGRDDRFTRKSAPTLIVRRPFVTVMGGIQPLLMEELSGGVPDGLMDRIMFAYPEPRPGYLGDEVASRAAEIAYENLFSDLMTLKPGQDEDHRDEPITLKLTADAWEVYKGIDQNFQDEAQEPTFDRRLAAQWAKSRGQLGRLALILAVCRFAEEKTPKDDQHVAVQDVMRAGQLLRYFKEHAKRVYEVQETVNVSQLVSSGLVAFMEQEGTTDRKISATDLQRELDEATLALLPADPGQFAKAVHQATEGDPRISSKPGRTHDGKAIHLQLLVANKPPDSDG